MTVLWVSLDQSQQRIELSDSNQGWFKASQSAVCPVWAFIACIIWACTLRLKTFSRPATNDWNTYFGLLDTTHRYTSKHQWTFSIHQVNRALFPMIYKTDIKLEHLDCLSVIFSGAMRYEQIQDPSDFEGWFILCSFSFSLWVMYYENELVIDW